ncbi:MAG: beta-N-acetylhexosaminidase [Candidatus Eremiobacteraeota bacterium]|nr:beta-N-acetylhexosaminidase [Candidatus Eremiobacteraeota bacterium]MBC5802491.1 beta-N-acetylhexosaminidase [Candidatus Eremiobacteraeota bacterium]MBC5821593.1 beta-N-acetylhexosaminidase [Candidatus Eremiobacteraeota bacterium]
MSELERLAGSVLCTGAPLPDSDDAAFERLQRLGPGAVVLFARDVASVETTRSLVQRLRAALEHDAPLSICVDQEGGRVARIGTPHPMPSMMTLGAAGDPVLAQRAGAAIAATVGSIGANVDFAPVLDLALEPESTVIGTRAFGDDPGAVAALGAAVVRGLQAAGIVAVVKHFPGHGATADDSHVALPVIDSDLATLRARDLVPFRAAFAAGARAVMTAHVRVTAFDDERPATQSPRLLRGLLRDELGFEGVCFTDCLEMAGAAEPFGGAVRAGVLALEAGADVLLVSHTLAVAEALRDALVAAVCSGDLPRARLEEAAERVRTFRFGHRAAPMPDVPTAAESDTIAREVAARGIAIVRGHLRIAPDVPVTIVSFEGASGDGVAQGAAERPSLSAALRRRRVRSELLRVPLEPDAAMIEQLVAVLEAQRAQGPRTCIVLARRAHLYPGQRRAVDAVLGASPEAFIVSAREPFDVPAFGRARTVACTFGDESTNIEALAGVLFGARTADGRIPLAFARVPA